MDENFTNKPINNEKKSITPKQDIIQQPEDSAKPDYSKLSSFSNYTEDRNKRIQNFSLNFEDDEDDYPVETSAVDSVEAPVYSGSPDDIGQDYLDELTRKFSVPQTKPDAVKPAPAKSSKPAAAKKRIIKAVTKATSASDTQKKLADENRKIRRRIRRRRKVRNSGYSVASRTLAFACCIVLILSITATLSSVALSLVNDILAYNSSSDVVCVDVPENAEFDEVIDIIADAGLIRQKALCKLFAKFRHYDGVKMKDGTFKKTTYISGVYYLESNMGLEAMLNAIKENTAASAETVSLSFPEGWTVAQIFEKLEKNEVCDAEKLYANLDICAKQFDFYKGIPTDSTRYLKCEGYLYPDTYDFYIGENANSVLKKLFTNFKDKWIDEYSKKAKDLGYSMDQVLTVASILQREAANKEQMPTIASIIYNRLDNSVTYPQLQCDSTLNYVNKFVVPYLSDSQSYLAQIYLNSYNTYSNEGLPPGPICNPGDDAIYAALNPADTDYYYFCHDSDGEIYLASTYEEQKANAAKVISGNGD